MFDANLMIIPFSNQTSDLNCDDVMMFSNIQQILDQQPHDACFKSSNLLKKKIAVLNLKGAPRHITL